MNLQVYRFVSAIWAHAKHHCFLNCLWDRTCWNLKGLNPSTLQQNRAIFPLFSCWNGINFFLTVISSFQRTSGISFFLSLSMYMLVMYLILLAMLWYFFWQIGPLPLVIFSWTPGGQSKKVQGVKSFRVFHNWPKDAAALWPTLITKYIFSRWFYHVKHINLIYHDTSS